MRNLKAIELAEGALLADIAVVLQFIVAFLPVGRSLFSVLIYVVFTVLVLRRGVHVGIMALCVGMFLVSVMIGPQFALSLLMRGLGGIFLGLLMKHRFPHLFLILLCAFCGATFVYLLALFFGLVTGFTVAEYVRSLQVAYETVLPIIQTTFQKLGMGLQWKQSVYPLLNNLAEFAFTYWWLAIYMILFVFLIPSVSVIYLVTHSFVRLLGYNVRPLLSGWFAVVIKKLRLRLLKLAIRWGVMKRI